MAERTGPARPYLVLLLRRAGWLVAGLGVVLLVLGWYGISGQATVAQQLPYLASASIPGAALVIGGLILASAERARGRAGERVVDAATVRRIADLHSLLTEPVTEPVTGPDPVDPDADADAAADSDAADASAARGDDPAADRDGHSPAAARDGHNPAASGEPKT